jgi:hypothetical protein
VTPTLTDTRTFTIRQSTLRHLEEHCPSMAYALSVEGLEGPSGPAAYRGTAIHDFFSRYVGHLFESGRQTDWSATEALLADVYASFPALSLDQRRDVAEQAHNVARALEYRPAYFYGTEEALATDISLVDGSVCTITGRLDYLEMGEGVARIFDVKSQYSIWPDSRVKDDFQLKTYALLVLDTFPHIDRVEGRLLLSRYGLSLPQKGEAVFTRADTDAFKEHLRYRLAAHFRGDLKGERVPGTHCSYCPLKRVGKCTLYRSYFGTTPPPALSPERARKLACQVMALERMRDERIELLKDYVKDHGPLAVGATSQAEVFGYHLSESEEIKPTALLRILEENRDLVGEQPLDDLLSIKKTSKTYKNLRHLAELAGAFSDAVVIKRSTRFDHKTVGGDE